MAQRNAYEFTARMRLLEEAYPHLDPDLYRVSQQKTLALLQRRGLMDLAPMLGLDLTPMLGLEVSA